jgi:hypothetical protein
MAAVLRFVREETESSREELEPEGRFIFEDREKNESVRFVASLERAVLGLMEVRS